MQQKQAPKKQAESQPAHLSADDANQAASIIDDWHASDLCQARDDGLQSVSRRACKDTSLICAHDFCNTACNAQAGGVQGCQRESLAKKGRYRICMQAHTPSGQLASQAGRPRSEDREEAALRDLSPCTPVPLKDSQLGCSPAAAALTKLAL